MYIQHGRQIPARFLSVRFEPVPGSSSLQLVKDKGCEHARHADFAYGRSARLGCPHLMHMREVVIEFWFHLKNNSQALHTEISLKKATHHARAVMLLGGNLVSIYNRNLA